MVESFSFLVRERGKMASSWSTVENLPMENDDDRPIIIIAKEVAPRFSRVSEHVTPVTMSHDYYLHEKRPLHSQANNLVASKVPRGPERYGVAIGYVSN